ncbi:MAG: tryptophan-rich sensory protein [Armatimonadetes bacterium]|nr:MAG: tryptophan-rich sensory protein [Armatimonadota bacterium]
MEVVVALLVLGVAVVGGWGSASAGDFYAQLAKPSWAPPSWLFGPVWAVLYLCIAIAGILYLRSSSDDKLPGMILFGSQLFLNAMWSWCFFAWRRGHVAFVVILLLLAAIVSFAWVAYRPSPISSFLFVPYAVWVGFAAMLNFVLWQRNSDVL